jgi:hypothetical protein
MHAANASCCMTLLLLAANAAGCMPHTPNLFLMKPTKQLQASDASAVLQWNGTANIRQQCGKTTVLSCRRCLLNTCVEKRNNI